MTLKIISLVLPLGLKMNTNVDGNADSEVTKPLNKRQILPIFLVVGLYAASTAAVMSVLPFYIREMGGSPLIVASSLQPKL